MPGLGDYIGGFLVADGFEVIGRDRGRLDAIRNGTDRTVRRTIWFADPDNAIVADEAKLLAAFQTARLQAADNDQAYFVTPTLAGLSTEFRRKATELGVGVRVPIQFFDTPYKSDGDAGFGTGRGSDARSAFVDFLREHKDVLATRVPQPFETLTSLGASTGGFGAGDDLLAHLGNELIEPPDGPCVTIVIGNAGAGKSYLFASVFDALNRHFATQKRAQALASRPILFLPAHIRDEQVRSMDGLLEAVAATDAAAATGPALMRWLNANGLTIWMFDGLDEFFAGEADFVAALEACLAPDSRSRVVICARDSLLTTSTGLRGFVDAHVGSGRVKLYELSRWGRSSQRALAWLRYEKRLPGEGEGDTIAVAGFLRSLEQSPAIAELATLPYYCDLLLGLDREAAELADEFDLLEAAVDGLIDREAQKLAVGELGFDWDVFSGGDAFVDTNEVVEALGTARFNSAEQRAQLNEVLRTIGRDRLVELIELLAHRMRMLEAYPNQGQGLALAELEEISKVYLDVGLMPGLEPRVLLALVQFAFFGPGSAKGHVRFAHEIIADYLAARHAAGLIRAYPESADALGQALGVRRDLERSIVFRYLVLSIRQSPELVAFITAHVESGKVRPAHVENARLLARALTGSAA